MTTQTVDEFLADSADVIAEWEHSPDSARWSADGSHELATLGRYYGEDEYLRQIRRQIRGALDYLVEHLTRLAKAAAEAIARIWEQLTEIAALPPSPMPRKTESGMTARQYRAARRAYRRRRQLHHDRDP